MKNQSDIKATAGIFLLYDGLPPTIIESQVLAHVRNMREIGVHMEVWAFAVSRHDYLEALSVLSRLRNAYPTITIRLFRGIRPALPLSEVLNALILLWHMRLLHVKIEFIQARTEHATMIAAIGAVFNKYRLIWDARGDTLSEYLESSRFLPWYLKWLTPLKVKTISNRINVAERRCDYAFFVSDALRRLQGSALPIDRALVVPCLADEKLFYFDQKLRDETRYALQYGDSDFVLIYVGSTAIWQCVPETISLMEWAMSSNPACKVLIVTPSRTEFEGVFSSDYRARVTVTSGELKDINSFLNAADFGVLLREKNNINWVASPVKFAEYSLSGLKVITTGAVDQVNEYGRAFGNTISCDQFQVLCNDYRYSKAERVSIAEKANLTLGRHSWRDAYASIYLESLKTAPRRKT